MRTAIHLIFICTLSFTLTTCKQDPVDTIWFSPDLPSAGDEIEFKAPGVSNSPEYDWDFDDGAINSSNDNTIKHTYTYSGTYHVKVLITDDDSNTSEYHIDVRVY